ncbi:hypothetical protein N7519_011804 [Penicillium mononematosum]|uniref:uncharacterized protein n=1 Tax=Penicillium mononematosum TaxID=268346 RepID=UPI002546E597|nr:uncharacterized protein N7519_011804 [Penicillium mononematosum]KAJ6181343.1 hypothetical protein N7519_011804 [Penicillium mononematosum]
MAANLGERSLADVHQEGLDEILAGLAHLYPGHSSHDTHSLGVPLLDTLLEVFTPKAPAVGAVNDGQPQPLSESVEKQTIEDEEMLLRNEFPAGQVYRPDEIHTAQNIDPSADVLFSESDGSKKRQVPIVEISSSLSASGKSQLLYYLTALAILPRKCGDISVSGQEAAVVFIDTDDRFDAERLRTVARDIVQQQRGLSESRLGVQAEPGGMPDHQLESLLVSSLQHVHVFRPQSSSALLATVHTLDSYLFDLSRHRSASRPLQMVAIDSATAFFWQDRLRDEVARTEEIGRPQVEIDSEREQKKRVSFSVQLCIPQRSQGGRASGPGQYDQPQARVPSLRPALPAPWGTFPTLRLIVHRSSVRPFPLSMAAHTAVKDAPSRQSVVQQGKISAWVNPWGRDEWPRRIVEALEANNGGSFSFYTRDSGVEMTDPHH